MPSGFVQSGSCQTTACSSDHRAWCLSFFEACSLHYSEVHNRISKQYQARESRCLELERLGCTSKNRICRNRLLSASTLTTQPCVTNGWLYKTLPRSLRFRSLKVKSLSFAQEWSLMKGRELGSQSCLQKCLILKWSFLLKHEDRNHS